MRKLVVVWVSIVVAGSGLIAAAPASAATEFGDACAGSTTFSPAPFTLFEVSHPENPLPTAAPVSGVLTGWRVNLVPSGGIVIPVTLKVLRLAAGEPATATVLAEATGSVQSGGSTFDARIPIQAGDRLGISTAGAPPPLICETGVAGVLGFASDSTPTGPVSPYSEEEGLIRVPLVGYIEPDVDGDGYGDETQDGCPQSALYHEACPVVKLDTIDLAGSRAATILVATSLEAKVKVKGTVKLGKGGKATIKAKAKSVASGRYGRFKLKFPSKLIKRLKELPPGKKLTMKVKASAPNIVGNASTHQSNLKLKGQAR